MSSDYSDDADSSKPVNVEGEDKLTVKAYDVSGHEMNVNYVWELAGHCGVCDSGFSLMGLGMLLTALSIRRKSH